MRIPPPKATHRWRLTTALLCAIGLLATVLTLPSAAQEGTAPSPDDQAGVSIDDLLSGAPADAGPADDSDPVEDSDPVSDAVAEPAAEAVEPEPAPAEAGPVEDVRGSEAAASGEPSAFDRFLELAAAQPPADPFASNSGNSLGLAQADVDTDGDGINDDVDLDDDNDGITDSVENKLEVNTVAGSHFLVAFPRNYFGVPTISQNLHIGGEPGTTLNIDGAEVTIDGSGLHSTSVTKEGSPGIHNQITEITSSGPVTIIAESYQQYTAEAWVVLPTPTLGTNYTAIGYPTSVGGSSPNFNAEINVIATEDNTSVQIGSISVTLDANQGYMWDAGNQDLSGVQVIADKPIAVLSSRRCLNTGQGACDIVGEQLFPDDALATDYYVPALAQPHATRVVASADNTQVQVNNTLVATLNRGEVYQTSGSGIRITASEPVVAWMIALGGELPGDPVFVLLPGLENALLKSTFTAPQSLYNNYLIMMAATADTGTVSLDGAGVPNNWVTFTADPAMSYQVIPISAGVHTVEAASSFVPIIYGETNYGSYGFVAGFGQAVLGTTDLVGAEGEEPELPDTDGDGVADSLDLDSDNDGISDLRESGQDAAASDTNENGVLDEVELGADADGLADGVEAVNGPDSGYTPIDSDGDGVADLLDLDSDADGIPDTVEAQSTSGYVAGAGNDADSDGIDDSFDPIDGFGGTLLAGVNTDGLADGPDHLDSDSDEDASSDLVESGLTMVGTDDNLDGIDDGVGASYADPNGSVNAPSADLANAPGTDTSEVAYRETSDSDGDGIADGIDLDDDNDGILDTAECGASSGLASFLTDSASAYNAAGADEWVSITAAEYATLRDGVDGTSVFGTQPGNEKTGTFSNFGGGATYTYGHSNNPSPADTVVYAFSRGTGVATAGGNDVVRLSPNTRTGFDQYGSALPNGTVDGNQEFFVMKDPSTVQSAPVYVGLSTDNNTRIYYSATGTTGAYAAGSTSTVSSAYYGWSLQGLAAANVAGSCDDIEIDTDGDGIPNRLDLDSDNDGISDLTESGQDTASVDTNNDGELDDIDGDNPNDGNQNGLAASVEVANGVNNGHRAIDSDGDGIPDFLDLDSDNDAIPDTIEAQSTSGYVPASGIDSDGDGVDNAWDQSADHGANFFVPVNSDGADTPDYLDTDSDNDGSTDTAESGLSLANVDENGDGIDDGVGASYADTDGSVNDPTVGMANSPGTDTSEVAFREISDTDGDGIADGVDLDDDNDGILDTAECGASSGVASLLTSSAAAYSAAGSDEWVAITGAEYAALRDGIDGTSVFGTQQGNEKTGTFSNFGGGATYTYGHSNNPSPANTFVYAFSRGTGVATAGGNDVVRLSDTTRSGFDQYGSALPNGTVDNNQEFFVLKDPSAIQTAPMYVGLSTDNNTRIYYAASGTTGAYAAGSTSTVTAAYYGWSLQGLASPSVAGSCDDTEIDTDGDGVPNRVDLDSDNDGISDLTESGQDTASVDTDNNGVLDDTSDADNDGIVDSLEAANGADQGHNSVDSDGDTIADFLDLDSDNDTIPDITESQPTSSYVGASGNDADRDGVDDNFDANSDFGGDFGSLINTDGEDNPDHLDNDTDNDGFDDIDESGITPTGTDDDRDGIDDGVGASYGDPDGIVNNPSGDLRNGSGDSSEVGYREITDTDGDGVADGVDLDDDNDGILDAAECGASSGVASLLTSSAAAYDAAGAEQWVSITAAEYAALRDGVDGTSVFGTPEGNEKTGTFSNFGGGAMYTYGHSNNPAPANTFVYAFSRGTGVATAGGNDIVRLSDTTRSGFDQYGSALPNGTVDNNQEFFVLKDPATLQTAPMYVGLSTDNNTRIYYAASGTSGAYSAGSNTTVASAYYGWSLQGLASPSVAGSCDDTEIDTDGDGIPNRLDLDSDNDGISDLTESGQDTASVDTNNDGVLDNDTDADADGIADSLEAANGADQGHSSVDSDGDGIADFLDLDSDNDAIADVIENQTTADYTAMSGLDSDRDGIDDVWDANAGFGGAFSDPVNTDSAEGPDYLDTDADNDGFGDTEESGITPAGTDADNDGIDDALNASYADPDGDINSPQTDLDNAANTDTSEVAYREISDTDGDGVADGVDIDDDNDGILDIAECGASSGVAALLTTSAAAYDAAESDAWISITAAEYAALRDGVDGTSVFGTPEGNEKTGTFSNFGGGAMYTYGHSNNPAPADTYVYAFSRGTGVATAGGNDIVRLSDTTRSGFDQYGSALPNGTVDNNQEFFVLKDPSVLQTDPVYVGLSTDNNTRIYYAATGTSGAYSAGSNTTVASAYYGWSLQGLASANVAGSCDDTEIDTDGDGMANRVDLDSDNDGISDLRESGQDAESVDVDNDGVLDDATDNNGNGLLAGVELVHGTDQGQPPVDTDSDGVTDFLDLDSDHDGIPDTVEVQETEGFIQSEGADNDNDGVDDAFDDFGGHGGTFPTPQNTDGADDGHDHVDADADNDAFMDEDESGLTMSGADDDLDGIDDALNASYGKPEGDIDQPSNMLMNAAGTDASEVAYREISDTDGDGIADGIDLDDDNDGILDTAECGASSGIAAILSSSAAAYDAAATDEWVSITAAEYAALRDGIDDTSVFGTPQGSEKTGIFSNFASGRMYSFGQSTNPAPANSYVFAFTRGTGVATTGGNDIVRLSANPPSGFGSYGSALPNGTLDNNQEYFVIKEPTTLQTDEMYLGISTDQNTRIYYNANNTDGGQASGSTSTMGASSYGWSLQGLAASNVAGSCDDTETDTDGDGIPNRVDLDSDNDGISDLAESGQDTASVDTDNDGIIDDDTDANANGIPDSIESANGDSNGQSPVDTDADGINDYLDLDSDDDGIPDIVEAQPTSSYTGLTGSDNDGDGVDDAFDGNGEAGGEFSTPENTDSAADGADYIDTDADNDGFDDSTESGLTLDGADNDNDGIDDAINASYNDPDGIIDDSGALANAAGTDTSEVAYREISDTDGDGIADGIDLDDDNDGISDEDEGGDDLDTDGDGVPNRIDLDSDNDGISDLTESGQDASTVDADNNGILDDTTDNNNDGVADSVGSGHTPSDTDNDGLSDHLDLDSDDDGIPDIVEAQPTSSYTGLTGSDNDGDGVDDAFDGNGEAGGEFSTPENTDSAADGADYIDTDADDDGFDDSTESGLTLDGADNDNDGIDDAINASYNDPDGIVDNPTSQLANGPNTDTSEVAYREISDGDGDGIADGIDLDDDNDGISDIDEGGDDLDTDGDGVPNRVDLDSDNDGISDLYESGQDAEEVDPDNNGVLDDTTDANANGIPDSVEAANGDGNGHTPADTDNDGLANHLDLDADNDRIPDIVESQSTAGYQPPLGADSDGDGVDDAFDQSADYGASFGTPTNTDGFNDGADFIDTDADQDGLADADESGLAASGLDTDNDGIDDVIGASYSDPDGVVDDPSATLVDDPETDESEVSYRELPVADVSREVMFLVDGSLSIDAEDWAIQLGGLAVALADPSVFPLDGTVAVSVIQWSDGPEIEIPYTVLSDDQILQDVIDEVLAIVQNLGGTSPEAGINAGRSTLTQNGSRAADQILCMSTDGKPVSPDNVLLSAQAAADDGIDSFAVLAIDDPSRDFDYQDALGYYEDAAFGTGSVVNVRSSIEFASVVVSGCLAGSVSLVGLEVNQAIQDWEGSVPLVEDKPTVVRAFLESSDSEPDRVVGRLHATRNGAALDQSPIVALNTGSSVLAYQNAHARRADLNSSLNFELPASWLSGDVELSFEVVGSEVLCKEAVAPANTCTADVSFIPVQSPQVSMYRVFHTEGGIFTAPTALEVREQVRRLESALPTGDVDFVERSLYTGENSAPTTASVEERLLSARTIDGSSRIYLGVLAGDRQNVAVAGDKDIGAGAWYLDGTGALDADGWSRNQGVQALVRALGLPLASDGAGNAHCTDPAVAVDGATRFPHEASIGGNTVPTLGPIGSVETEIWGIDPRFIRTDLDLAVINPKTTFSVMGNCNPTDLDGQGRWIDESYYTTVLSALNGLDWAVGPQSSSSELAFFRGSLDGNSASFDNTVEVETSAAPAAVADGEYTLELRNADGDVVESVDFAPTDLDGTDGVFTIPVEDAPAFDQAVIVRAGSVLGVLQASDNAPTVAVTTPVLNGTDLVIEWTGDDADGDVLTYLVQYSVDGGQNWNTIAIDFPGTALVIPGDALVGSDQVQIRVTASDGALSASDTSASFSVADAAPSIEIVDPVDGQRFDGVQTVYLEAEAIDAEDGQISGDSITWTSNVDGALGTGSQVVANAADMTVGFHEITATVSDSAGNLTDAAVTIEIQRVADALNEPIGCQGLAVTVNMALGELPTEGDDVILGTAGPDIVLALGGNDVICGLGGNDTIYGQDGDDIIFGGDGEDKLRGGDGNDEMYGGNGADDLSGGRGDDFGYGEAGDDKAIRGGTGDDHLDGGDGNDALISGNGGSDTVLGGAGDDVLSGGPRPDVLSGGDGNDFIRGNWGADIIDGGAGDDDLRGGPSPDTITGGEGTDYCNGGTTGDGAIESDFAESCEELAAMP